MSALTERATGRLRRGSSQLRGANSGAGAWKTKGWRRARSGNSGPSSPNASGIDSVRVKAPPRVQELDLRAPRLVPPASLEPVFSTDPYDRAAHTYGRSFRDLVRAFRRDYAHAPDLVAFPRGEDELVSVLDWCCDAGVAAIPYGGGSSVVGWHRAWPVGAIAQGGDDRPAPPRPRARDRCDFTGRARSRRRVRSFPRESAQAERSDVASLPAVVRVLLAGRLDRHARRRSLCNAVYAHRRVRGVVARRDAGRRAGIVPPSRCSGAGPSPIPCSSAAKAFSASSSKRGCGCGRDRSSARAPRCSSPALPTRCRRPGSSRSPGSTRPTAACSATTRR